MRADFAALSGRVGTLLRTKPAGDRTRFATMDLTRELIEAGDQVSSDAVMQETLFRWIGMLQQKHLGIESNFDLSPWEDTA